jgi:hypothetical protein
VITEFPIPTGNTQPQGITAGPDGALWFTETAGNNIGRISFAGPTLVVFPASNISAKGNQGGPFLGVPSQYQVSTSSGSFDFSISGVSSWLTASTYSGTATTMPLTVTFSSTSSVTNMLPPGTYGPVTITFTNATNGVGTQTRTATLVVQPRTSTHDFNNDANP